MAPRSTRRSVWKVPTAAEDGQPAAAEHGTTIAYANVDWKRVRHTGKHATKQFETWQRTTEEIIRKFDPAIICFCEVGEVSIPMEAEHFTKLQALTREAWTSCGVAAEQVEFLQTVGLPYLTAYRKDRVMCSGYRILDDLYTAKGGVRTAQHFLATRVDTGAEESINVINVHAPSGTWKLTDAQRRTLLTNLLQST